MSEDGVTIKRLRDKFPDSIIESHSFRGDDTVIIKKEDIVEVCRFLRDEKGLAYNFMMDLTVVDYLNIREEPRFEVVYHLYSLEHNHRVRIKAPVSESDCSIDSIISLWIGANWFEREAYDMYGIIFKGHPDIRRILLYKEFKGHPLRKDYPVQGRQPLIGPKN
ncbi:MAG: NADH-quinone oxidoreductase subunit C [Nitrospinae bacterium]|nr:NADH-quinone oxidoreductase subunit C [Nitrospinota bacterium]